jgi:hypothetical protein
MKRAVATEMATIWPRTRSERRRGSCSSVVDSSGVETTTAKSVSCEERSQRAGVAQT